MGAGAIGSVVGGMLTQAGHDVTLIDQWPPHIEAMKANGLTLSGSCGDHVVNVKAIQLYEAQDLVAASFLAQYAKSGQQGIDPAKAKELACQRWFGAPDASRAPNPPDAADRLTITGAIRTDPPASAPTCDARPR